MKKTPPPKPVCIACSIFRSEIKSLQESGDFSLPVKYLSSMLHMHPERLREKLEPLIREQRDAEREVLILYGDCHAYMHDQASLPGVTRVRGINCPEILLGQETYRRLRRAGVFFMLPEWTLRWREVFEEELGLNPETGPLFMREMHTQLLYLDTGVIPVPDEILNGVSAFTGLPWEARPVTPEPLLRALRAALKELEGRDVQ